MATPEPRRRWRRGRERGGRRSLCRAERYRRSDGRRGRRADRWRSHADRLTPMLCRACRVHVRRDFPYCLHCGTVRPGVRTADFSAPELSIDRRSVALVKQVTTIGRAPDNDVVLDDPSVSRHHARITRRD